MKKNMKEINKDFSPSPFAKQREKKIFFHSFRSTNMENLQTPENENTTINYRTEKTKQENRVVHDELFFLKN